MSSVLWITLNTTVIDLQIIIVRCLQTVSGVWFDRRS